MRNRNRPRIPYLRTPNADVNGILLSPADLKALLKCEKGRKFLQNLLNLGKEIKVLVGYQWSRKITLPGEEMEELMHRKDWSRKDLMLYILLEYCENCYFLGKPKLNPKILVFKKPYHTLDHIIKWIGKDTISRGRKDFNAVYEEIKRLCRIVGIFTNE